MSLSGVAIRCGQASQMGMVSWRASQKRGDITNAPTQPNPTPTDYVAACRVIMTQPQTIFIRVGLRAPWSYCAVGNPIFVPAISLDGIASASGATDVVEVTSVYDASPWRRFVSVASPLDVALKDGRRYVFPQALGGEALNGGGWFMEYWLNPICDEPITPEEYEARKLADTETDALYLAMDW